nr:MAG TPA: hypothetical protein [Caudoviricetes sp.]
MIKRDYFLHYNHFAATIKEKGATLSRNPLIYLLSWRCLNWCCNWLKYLF